MKAMLLNAPERLAFDDVARPTPGPGEILIRVTNSGICGTDLKIYRGAIPVAYPRIMGHEMIGEVADAGEDHQQHSEPKQGANARMGIGKWRGQHFGDQRPHHNLNSVPREKPRAQPFVFHKSLHFGLGLGAFPYSTSSQLSLGLNS